MGTKTDLIFKEKGQGHIVEFDLYNNIFNHWGQNVKINGQGCGAY